MSGLERPDNARNAVNKLDVNCCLLPVHLQKVRKCESEQSI